MEFLFILAVSLVAGTLSGIVGFGSSIMLMPVLVIAFGPLQAVPVMAIAAIMANLSRLIELALGVFFIAMIGVRRWMAAHDLKLRLVHLALSGRHFPDRCFGLRFKLSGAGSQSAGGSDMNRDEYVQKLKTQLDEWNAEAANWEARTRTAQDEVKIEYERQLALFHQRRDEGLRKMKEVQAASSEAWMETIRGADDAWKRMQDAFNQARSKFGK